MAENKRTEQIVDLRDLYVSFRTFKGYTKVLNGVNLKVGRREKISIVGETGCGKTTTVYTIAQILAKQAKIDQGEVYFKGDNVLQMSKRELKKLRGQGISIIFQDPIASLNPVFTIGNQMKEIIRYSGIEGAQDKNVQMEKAIAALKETRLPDPERIYEQLSFPTVGRYASACRIAMSLATPRDLVIADEPTTNLDVTIQDQVLKTLKQRVEEKESSLILITHSLGVARMMADRIYVMYAGNMVEVARSQELFEEYFHPYTKGLMGCVPKLSGGGISTGIPGHLPNYMDPPKGCRFSLRCPHATERCRQQQPPLYEVRPEHYVACYLYEEEAATGEEGGVK